MKKDIIMELWNCLDVFQLNYITGEAEYQGRGKNVVLKKWSQFIIRGD